MSVREEREERKTEGEREEQLERQESWID